MQYVVVPAEFNWQAFAITSWIKSLQKAFFLAGHGKKNYCSNLGRRSFNILRALYCYQQGPFASPAKVKKCFFVTNVLNEWYDFQNFSKKFDMKYFSKKSCNVFSGVVEKRTNTVPSKRLLLIYLFSYIVGPTWNNLQYREWKWMNDESIHEWRFQM